MYRKGDKTISIEEASSTAEAIGLSLEEWATKYGWATEGKMSVPEDMTPPTEPVKKAAAGDSSLADTSLESPEIKGVDLDWKELFKNEEDVAAAINEQISEYGLIAETANVFGNAITIRKRQSKKDEQGFLEKYSTMIPELIYKTATEPFTSIEVGPDRDVKDMLADINSAVKELADTNYLTNSKESVTKEWENYKQATTAPEIPEKELESSWLDAKSDEFEEMMTSGSGEVASAFMFSDPKDYERYKQWENDRPMSPPTEEELEEFKGTAKEKYREAQSAKYMNNLEPWQRETIDALSRNELKVLEADAEAFTNRVAKYEELNAEMPALIKDFEAEPTIEKLNNLREKENQLNSEVDVLKASQKSLAAKAEDLPAFISAVDNASKDYNRLRQLGSNFKAMAPDVMYLYGQLDEALGIKGSEFAKAQAIDLKRDAEKELATYQKSIEFEGIGDLDDAGRWVAGSATSLIPSLSLAATGPLALPLFFMTGAGGKGIDIAIQQEDAAFRLANNTKILENNPDLDWEEKSRLEDEIYTDKQTLNISTAQKLSAQATFGIAEVVFERVGTLRILKNLKNATKLAPPKSVHKAFARASKQFVINANREGASELATLVLDNIADVQLLGEDKNIFEGIGETYAQGALMGAGLSVNSAMLVKESIVSELANRAQTKRLREITLKLSELTGVKLQNTELGALGAFGNQTPEVRRMVEELTAEATGIKEDILESFASGNLSVEELNKIGEHNRKMREINKEFTDIATNPNVTPAELKAAETDLRKKFDAENEARLALIDGVNGSKAAENNISFDATQGYASYSTRMFNEGAYRIASKFGKEPKKQKQILFGEAKIALESEGKKPTEKQIEDRALEDYINKEYRSQIERGANNAKAYAEREDNDLNIEFIEVDGENSVEEFKQKIQELYENGRISEKDYKEVIAGLKDKNASIEGVNLSDISKSKLKDIIIIDKRVSAANGRVGVYAHEVLHSEFKERVKTAGGNIDAIGKEFLDYMEANHSDLHAKIMARLEASYNEDGELDMEEAMNAFSDILADGDTVDANVLDYVKRIINRVIGRGALKTGEHAFYFIRDFNKTAHFGGKNKVRPTFKQGIAQPEEEELEGKMSISVQADRAKQVLEKVSANMDFFDPNSPLIARVLPGMIQAQLAKLSIKGLQFDMDEANSDIIYRLYSNNDIGKFDGRGTLYGYVNGRISFRIKDMLKASGEGKNDIVEDFNQSDVEDLKGVSADVTTTEQIEERVEAERPQYRPLLDSRVVTPEVIETIKGKIPRIVGTLKSRIDAPVSKNTTVTPLVNELRLALGKQIDIDLKTAMGGKKDGQLRKWLTSNKKAILENMTTTYLMSAFPAAIQKKVDGVWTSDWKGKKIDRETTATDMAGRTSGAEMVRRLPQASIKIDDKTFLSFVLEESGNPIRGKKESIAKAVAEELSLEIVNQEMQNPESEIRQAFDANQERLEVELLDNHVQKLALDFERGNVKFSKGFTRAEARRKDVAFAFGQAISIYKELEENRKIILLEDEENKGTFNSEVINQIKNVGAGLKNPVDVSNVPFEKIFATLQYLEKEGLLNFVAEGQVKISLKESNLPAFDETFVKEWSSLATLTKRAKDNNPEAIAELEQYNQEVSNTALLIDPREVEAFGGGAIFGDKNIAKAAESSVLQTQPSQMSKEQLNAVEYYTSKTGVARRVVQAQQGSGTASKTAKSGLAFDIQKANIANRKLSTSIAKTFITAVKRGDLSEKNFLRFLQHMNNTQDKKGFRALGTLEYISSGISGSAYMEHVYPNSALMFDLASLAADETFELDQFGNLDENSNNALNEIFAKNTLWATDLNTAALIDKLSKTNKSGIERMRVLDLTAQEKIFSTVTIGDNLQTLKDHLDDQEKVELYKKQIGIKWSKASAAKDIIAPSVKFSLEKPTAIFMVGGPGAGKSSVLRDLELTNKGYRLINQDPYLEKYIKEAGLSSDEKTYNKEERSLRAKLGWKARKAAEEDLARNTAAKESMVVDGTGASYKATTKKMKALEDAGFEIHMIFVNTSKDVAVQRNRARAERSLADFIVTKTWDSVQESAKQYKEDYAGRFYEINTDNLSYGEALPSDFVNKVNNGLEASGVKFSKGLSEGLNEMLERTKGVAAGKEYTAVQAKMMGEKKGKYKLFVPSSADDFRGLTSYTFAGKGKQGEADQKFFEENLINPYVRGVAMIEAVKQQIRREYHAVAKANKQYFKMLGKKISNTEFTYDQALRVYMWTQQGIEVPGMSKDDISFLINEINQFPGLIELGNAMQIISRQETWVEPTEHWMSHTLVSDLNSMTEKVGRQKYLQEFLENSEAIFSKENLNKIEAVYGTRHREAIEDALYSMKNGRNRPSGANKQMNQWMNWINNSTGAIMFFNIRSAVLQTLSATNFINWSDNNPAKAAMAFANQKQYWADFAMIFNSDKLKQRRSGLQTDVNQAEIANQAEGAKDKASAVIAYLLKIGFTPTQIADSFAISMGGASMYRNRVNTYLKEGLSKENAEKQAFEDFSKTADEAQQSSDPYLVSQEQRSPLGRLVLAFQNTPMQYTRLMKKAMQDLANGRGDAKTHISKIIYYGAVQNFVFSALQSALFAMIPGFDDEEDESMLTTKELEKKREKEQRTDDTRTLRIVNSMTDSILKGSGLKGAVLATIKNTITEYFKQEEKGFTADHTYTILQALSLSPPIGSKARKIYSAIQSKKFDKDVLAARGFSITADGRLVLSPAYSIIGSLASGVANIPLDRVVDIINSYAEALDARNTAWQRIALALGWKTWDVGAKNEEHDLIKIEAKKKRKEEGKIKSKETRKKNKETKDSAEAAERLKLRKMTPSQRAIYLRNKKK